MVRVVLMILHDGFQGPGELRKLCNAVAAIVKDKEPLHLRRSRKGTANISLQILRVDFKSSGVCYYIRICSKQIGRVTLWASIRLHRPGFPDDESKLLEAHFRER